MQVYNFVGLDIHKKSIAYCVKRIDGKIVEQGRMPSTRKALHAWAISQTTPWIGAMEATLFTGWIYEFLKPHGALKVGNPLMIKAISAAKHKNDHIDAATLADLLRCDLLPECYMPPKPIRELRRALRFRNMMVQQATRMKNKIATLLMEVGAEYSKQRLHGKKYFYELLDSIEDVPPSVLELLAMSRASLELFEQVQKKVQQALLHHPELSERVERLRSIPGVGEVTALTWALEIGEPARFSSISKALSYCGLCSGQKSSAGKEQRMPISKQRNKHLQHILIEAAQLAPLRNPRLATEYQKQKDKGAKHNEAVISVARKLVAYLLALDKSGETYKA